MNMKKTINKTKTYDILMKNKNLIILSARNSNQRHYIIYNFNIFIKIWLICVISP